MERYEALEIEVIRFLAEDIVTVSPDPDDPDSGIQLPIGP